jgi:hypothetical protein
MVDEKQQKYVNVLFPTAQLKKIDDFRFKQRFQSRTEAIRWLLEWALKQNPKVERE